MKKLSIVIITLNEEKYISQTLECLSRQSFQNFELIIVDSDSDDNTEKVALKSKHLFEEFQFVNMKSRGVSKGRNTGGKLAKYENILFLDADTTFHKGFLENLMSETHLRQLETAAVQMTSKEKSFFYAFGFLFMNMGMRITQYFSPTGVGACLYSKKYVFDAIGGFDERISLCEDCDYLKRSKSAGYKFGVLKEKFYFDLRRLGQDGLLKTYFKYIRANFHRFTKGELIDDDKYDYKFGHYK